MWLPSAPFRRAGIPRRPLLLSLLQNLLRPPLRLPRLRPRLRLLRVSRSDVSPYNADPAELRRELPIAYVLEAYGHAPASSSGGRLHYLSPFRPDSNPVAATYQPVHRQQTASYDKIPF